MTFTTLILALMLAGGMVVIIGAFSLAARKEEEDDRLDDESRERLMNTLLAVYKAKRKERVGYDGKLALIALSGAIQKLRNGEDVPIRDAEKILLANGFELDVDLGKKG